jgi:carnitine O-acetyltransferase
MGDAELIHRMVKLSQHVQEALPKAGVPACPAQYANIFGYFAQPLADRYEPIQTPHSQHITVFYHGQCYSLTVIEDGTPISAARIEKALNDIRHRTATPDAPSIGPLTWLNRDQQARAWDPLRQLNHTAVEAVETALFTVCLDDETTEEPLHHDLVGPANNRLHNQTQLICRPGHHAFNIEHSGVDGTTWLRVIEWLRLLSEDHVQEDAAEEAPAKVDPLSWQFDDTLTEAIASGLRQYQDRNGSLVTEEVTITHPNLEAIKACGVSPDALIQVVMQLAYLRTCSTPPKLSYESINLRSTFWGARTAAGMPLTDEVVALNKAWKRDTGDRLALLKTALGAHTKRCAAYRQNGSPYRLLQALRWAAQQPESAFSGQEFPFLNHPFLAPLDDLGLSTSNCSSDDIQTFGFHPDGAQIGIGYRLNGELKFCLTTDPSNAKFLAAFIEAFKDCLTQCMQLLLPVLGAIWK